MKFLSSYLDFIFEAVAKKEMRLHYSPKFRELIKRMSKKNTFANFLLMAEDSNQISDIYTLIDITEKNDIISFIQVNRILRSEPDTKTYTDSDVYFLKRNITNDVSNDFWHKGRTEIGVGRWLRRIIVDVHKSSITDKQIEDFVNQYKSTFDGEDTNFEIVSGEEIKKWYLESNYESVKGHLGNSCMRYKSCQDYFDIYVKNPDVCSLLIMKSDIDSDKIVGRSLLWQLLDGRKYQDRVYTINDSDRNLFEDWAEKNGYITHDGAYGLKVQLGNHEYQKYPYMDTFIAYNPKTKLLEDDESLWPESGYYLLQDTKGGFRSDDVVWSDWSEEYIPRESAVRCNNVNDWLDKSEAKYLEYKDEWVAPVDDVVYSEWSDEWYYLDDCHYSECMSDWLYVDDENVITMFVNEYGDEDHCVKSLYELYVKVGNDYYSRKACVKDPFTGEYKFKTSEYEKSLDEKLMKEFGIEINDTTIDRRGNPSTKVIDDVREDLKLRLLKLKLSDDIKKLIEENPIYKKQVRGVYWGLHKDDMPTEEDIFALLKSFMVSKNTSSYQGSVYLSNVMGKFVFFRSEEMNKSEQKFRKFHSCGVLQKMIRVCLSFDFSQFPEDIYKRYLFTTI